MSTAIMTDQEMISILTSYCVVAAQWKGGDKPFDGWKAICKEIGETLNDRGGCDEMLRVFDMFPRKVRRGARSLDFVWDGIGDWEA
jgi:hypothetical protein